MPKSECRPLVSKAACVVASVMFPLPGARGFVEDCRRNKLLVFVCFLILTCFQKRSAPTGPKLSAERGLPSGRAPKECAYYQRFRAMTHSTIFHRRCLVLWLVVGCGVLRVSASSGSFSSPASAGYYYNPHGDSSNGDTVHNYPRGDSNDAGEASTLRSQYTTDNQTPPIDYNFYERGATRKPNIIPRATTVDEDEEFPRTGEDATDDVLAKDAPRVASPRQDIVARYMHQTSTRLLLLASCSAVGGMLGAFCARSLVHERLTGLFAQAGALVFLLTALLRNAYSELVKALGMTLILAVQRSRRLRKHYPSGRYLKAALGAGPRRPFPPADNPWAYQGDVEFNMLYTVIAMALVGSTCGGSLPVIPTWMGALGGAAMCAFVTTLPTARGDLLRCMGMRVVALSHEVWDIHHELGLLRKLGVVSGKVFDKMMILDRKHRIKDRLIKVSMWIYDKTASTVSQVQSDMQARDESGDRRPRRGGPPPRDERPGERRPPPR